jgi:hypothetical protein
MRCWWTLLLDGCVPAMWGWLAYLLLHVGSQPPNSTRLALSMA